MVVVMVVVVVIMGGDWVRHAVVSACFLYI